jgi:hypothetical protein
VLKKNANGNRTGSVLGLPFAFFSYVFSLNVLTSTAYECNAFALKPRPLL